MLEYTAVVRAEVDSRERCLSMSASASNSPEEILKCFSGSEVLAGPLSPTEMLLMCLQPSSPPPDSRNPP